jgi:hypothetical protein
MLISHNQHKPTYKSKPPVLANITAAIDNIHCPFNNKPSGCIPGLSRRCPMKRTVIIGASSGIGRELARLYAKEATS